MIVKELLDEIERLREMYPEINAMSVGTIIIEPKEKSSWDATIYYGRGKFVQVRDNNTLEVVGRLKDIEQN